MASADLATFAREWESREEALSLEYYNQYAGLPASEERMTRLAEDIQRLARDGLSRWARGDVPDRMFFAMVGNRDAREETRLQNDVYRLRNTEVTIDVAGEAVNLNNVRMFNFRHARENELRRRAFDAILAKARILTPTLEARFRLARDTYGAFGVTPLDAYCVDENVPRARLERVVDDSALRARKAFVSLADEFARELFGKPRMGYEDDMYVYRHTIYAPIDEAFRSVDYVATFRATAKGLGLDVDAVAIDGEPRPGKYASPVCFGVKIPGDVRVLYQRTSPFGDYESFYHEMGHGVHFASVHATQPFWERRLIPNGVAEIFSTLFEELSMNPVYLAEDVGLSKGIIAEVERRRRFMELYFLAFYGANSMHKIRFWAEDMASDFARADEAYEELTERYMGVRVPGIYWQTHHILSMSNVYAPSYLLANIRKSELVRALEKQFGDRWWRERDAGEFLSRDCMGPGGAIDLAAFSTLDAEAYVARVTREPGS